MTLVYNQEQRHLKDSAADFVRQEMPVSALRQLRDSPDRPAFNPRHWQQISE